MHPFRRAALQYGLISWAQLRAAGVAASTISDWVRIGRLRRVQPQVYLVVGTPWSWEQDLFAAVLAAGPGAVASHRAGCCLWGIVDEGPIEITVPRGRTPALNGAVIVHQSIDRPAMFHRRRIPVTSPMRALLDLAAVANTPAVVEAIDRAEVARLCRVAAVEWQLNSISTQGRRGIAVLRSALDVQALLDEPPEGMLEPRFARLVKRYRLPAPVFQHRVGRFRIDFAYPQWMIAIEVDGYGARSTRRRFQSDTDRQNDLTNRGWTVVRFTWNDVIRRPQYVAEVILTELRRAQSGIPA